MVQKLVSLGYLKRVRSEKDKRIVYLAATKKLRRGVELYEDMKLNELNTLGLTKKNAPNKSRFYPKPPRWFTCKTAGRRRTIHPHYRRGAKIAFARVHACAHMHTSKLANERKRKKKALRTKRKESPQTLRKLCRVRARTLTSVVPPMMMRTSASGTKYYRR